MISVRPRAIALLFLSALNGYSIKAMTKFQEKRDPNLKIKMSFAFLITTRAPPTLRLPSKNGNRALLYQLRAQWTKFKKMFNIYILDYKTLNIEISSAKTFRLHRLDPKLIKSSQRYYCSRKIIS